MDKSDELEASLDGHLSNMKKLENALMSTLTLAGIKEIVQVKIDDESVLKIGTSGKDTGKLIRDKENVLRTSGVNLQAVLSQEGVDSRRTVSNDIIETFNVLGIEAARQALMTYGCSFFPYCIFKKK